MCAIKIITSVNLGGQIGCWGSNQFGQVNIPSNLQDSEVSLTVAAGIFHTCSISVLNMLQCWGNNLYYQSTVPHGFILTSVFAHARLTNTCAISMFNGKLGCWGSNE